MKSILLTISLICSCSSHAQLSETDIAKMRKQHLNELTDTRSNYLTTEEIADFQGLDYYPFESSFQIPALFIKDKGEKFEMPTSTERLPIYRRFGYIYFTIDSIPCQLTVYQNIDLLKRNRKKYKNYLFIPFKDKTTRIQTYGAGRFLDFERPKSKKVIVDFNMSYNPYCAYSYRYSCPIPPKENTLNVEITAGERIPLGH